MRRCIIKSDSQVVVGHVEKEFTMKEPELIKYLAAVTRMEKHFARFTFRHIPRSENAKADELAMPADVFLSRAVSQSNTRRRGTAQHHACHRK